MENAKNLIYYSVIKLYIKHCIIKLKQTKILFLNFEHINYTLFTILSHSILFTMVKKMLIVNSSKTYPKNAKMIPNRQIKSNMYSAFKPISDDIHNNVGFELNLSNSLGLSLINVFLAGSIPFSPNIPVTICI
jgi:hypothetical protein